VQLCLQATAWRHKECRHECRRCRIGGVNTSLMGIKWWSPSAGQKVRVLLARVVRLAHACQWLSHSSKGQGGPTLTSCPTSLDARDIDGRRADGLLFRRGPQVPTWVTQPASQPTCGSPPHTMLVPAPVPSTPHPLPPCALDTSGVWKPGPRNE
jgi:hypothetical protein